ncbi:MAG: GGDEF domain-containing protein [Sulfurospirillaceae bacterium]|nr:GGDEF domain-containing protein [Sulfurospirillaceae bacterium]MDD2826420.1 GGDEF domain-containing protein [Sulfurospirillaceae bacterium]
MPYIKDKFYSFHMLCFGAILLGWIAFEGALIPNYAYYFLWQSTFVFLLLAIALSIYFNKSKLFVLLLFPLFFNLALAFPTTFFNKLSVTAFWHIAPLCTALGFLIIYALQERGLFSSFGLVRSSIGLFFLMIAYTALKNFSSEMQTALSSSLLPASLGKLTKASDFVTILSVISLSFILLISLLFEAKSQKAPFWMLFAQMIAFLFLHDKNSFILFSLITSLIAIAALSHDAYRMAYIDTLTGIPGRRALEEAFLRLSSHYTIAMVDIDFFKKFNDKFGHDIGDDVLKLIATELSHVKNGGKVFRYGGEEFTVLFRGKKKEDCILALEEIRESIFKRGFVLRDKERPTKAPHPIREKKAIKKERLTVSIGVASSSKGKSPEEIVKIADNALYQAKESGRNCLISL